MSDERPAAGATTLSSLIRALETLAEQSATLAEDVRADAAARRAEETRRRKATLATLAVAVLLALGVVAVLVIGWQNAAITRSNNEINRRVADCTTAGGQCYERGAARTGAAIDELVRANLYLHQCLDDPAVDGDAEVQACLTRKLKASRPPN